MVHRDSALGDFEWTSELRARLTLARDAIQSVLDGEAAKRQAFVEEATRRAVEAEARKKVHVASASAVALLLEPFK